MYISSMTLYLEKYEMDHLLHLTQMITANPTDNPNLFCEQAKMAASLVLESIRIPLEDFSKWGSSTGVLWIHGFPMEFVVTPTDNNQRIGETSPIAKIQAILAKIMGEMVAYEAEGYGRLFQDVVPTKSMASQQTSLGSQTELEIHTEQAFSPLRPDILSLSCIRGDPAAFTHIFSVNSIIQNLTEEEVDRLWEPLWMCGVDLSFRLSGLPDEVRGPMSILNGSKKDPVLIFDQDLMRGITPMAQELLTKIVELYYSHRQSYNLTSGDIIFIDNRRAVHGRSPFLPKFDGKDRFLVRCFIKQEYGATRYARPENGHMIQAMYS